MTANDILTHLLTFVVGAGAGFSIRNHMSKSNINKTTQKNIKTEGDVVGRDKKGK